MRCRVSSDAPAPERAATSATTGTAAIAAVRIADSGRARARMTKPIVQTTATGSATQNQPAVKSPRTSHR